MKLRSLNAVVCIFLAKNVTLINRHRKGIRRRVNGADIIHQTYFQIKPIILFAYKGHINVPIF